MLYFHAMENAAVTLAVKSRKSSRYLLFNSKNKLCGWKSEEKGETKLIENKGLKLNPLSFMGIHVVSPHIFSHLPLSDTFSIIESYLKMAKEGIKIVSYRADSAFWLDLGNLQNIKKAEQKLTNNSII
jgi:NDP-sugar pyrophosphorylase family protein